MSKSDPNMKSKNDSFSKTEDEPNWQPASQVMGQGLKSLASLRLTVALFAMSIFIVLAGTLGQVDRDVWEVIDAYFRFDKYSDSPLIQPFAWIELKIFFPPSFFAGEGPPDLSQMTSPARIITALLMGFGCAGIIWLIPFKDKKLQFSIFSAVGISLSILTTKFNGFWFPKGWTIGLMMGLNLLAAHLIRFKIQAKDTRLLGGAGVMAAGMLATALVIMGGNNKDGVLQENKLLFGQLGWDTIWMIFQLTTAIVCLIGAWTAFTLGRQALEHRRSGSTARSHKLSLCVLTAISTSIVAGLLAFTILNPEDFRIGESGMRILWQLLKATIASLILLAGCVLVFRKRAGVVLLHGGIALLMFSELLVGVAAVEGQMPISEGESSNFTEDNQNVEIAIVDESGDEEDRVVVIPEQLIEEGETLSNEKLPFDIHVKSFFPHSDIADLKPDEENPATMGFAARGSEVARAAQGSTGTDNASSVDIASAYVTLKDKSGDDLGTWLLTQYLPRPQDVEIDGKTYRIELRFKRTYKPYRIHLIDVSKTDYLGTSQVKDYRSKIRLVDETRNEDREVEIWMNNPLRYAGETFYQSGYNKSRDGTEITTLQVVTNTGWMIPYVSCMIVAVGMLAHFLITLSRFLNRQPAPVTKRGEVAVDDPFRRPPKRKWLVPVVSTLLILTWGGYLASKARPPKTADDAFDFYQAGQIPVAYEGRVKPLDTLARNVLRLFSRRQTFEDSNGDKQPAMKWFLDLITNDEVADEHRVFRIDYPDLIRALGLKEREGFRYSFEEIRNDGKGLEILEQQERKASQLKDASQRTLFHTKVLELGKNLRLYYTLRQAFQQVDLKDREALMTLSREVKLTTDVKEFHPPLMISHQTGEWDVYHTISLRSQLRSLAKKYDCKTENELAFRLVDNYSVPLVARALKTLWTSVRQEAKATNWKKSIADVAREKAEAAPTESLKTIYETIADAKSSTEMPEMAEKLPEDIREELFRFQLPGLADEISRPIAQRPWTGDADSSRQFLAAMLEILIGKAMDKTPLDVEEPKDPFGELLTAYKADDKEAFAKTLANKSEWLQYQEASEFDLAKIRFESFFNNAAPFFYLAFVYVFAGLVVCVAWLLQSQAVSRSAFWLLVFAFLIHTAALAGRTYISGRPPVTNLYSSAVFIGWACVLMGLIFEQFFRIGFGSIVASVVGFLTLGVAHLLDMEVPTGRGDADTITVLQAVLDTQFWLATHVVCISLGYAATYVAGFMGIAYIMGGMFTPMMNERWRKDLTRMTYATICFAIFFSFVGTVLGGLWADDSWGRFWGWDPKENGALIIVLWNALVLHARWGGLVKERGLAGLAVAGNIAVSWSWFGVNQLGQGLHAYGFTKGVTEMLAAFAVSQLIIIGIGMVPKEFWWSHLAEQNPPEN